MGALFKHTEKLFSSNTCQGMKRPIEMMFPYSDKCQMKKSFQLA